MAHKNAGRQQLRVLIAGGGTGGHVIPALAIGRQLRDRYGAEVLFVGPARGLETSLVPEAGFPLELIHVGQLKGVSLVARLRTLADLPLGVVRCMALLRDFRPAVVIGVGGYASGPAMMAAILLRVPTLAFEPNAVPGLANRLVGKWVSAAAVNFAPTSNYFRNAEVTGIPVRSDFFTLPRRPKDSAPRLLVFGGSQGARVLNETMPLIARQLLEGLPGLTITPQTGKGAESRVRASYESAVAGMSPILSMGPSTTRYNVREFIADMPGEFARADLILCSSGASTVAELAAAGKPSVLVPFPQAADDHQRKNADVLLEAGAARLLVQSELTPEKLLGELRGLLENQALMEHMGRQAKKLAHEDAVQRIAQMVQRLAKGSASR